MRAFIWTRNSLLLVGRQLCGLMAFQTVKGPSGLLILLLPLAALLLLLLLLLPLVVPLLLLLLGAVVALLVVLAALNPSGKMP